MILGLIEHDRGTLNKASLEMLTLARGLADELGEDVEAVIVGENGRSLADELGAYGVETVYLATHDDLDDYAPEAWAQSVVQIVEEEEPEAVLAIGSERGNEVMAHVAARMGAALAANVTEVTPGDSYQVTRVRWGGSLLEEALLHGDIKLLTVAPHVIAAEEADEEADADVNEVEIELEEKDFRVRVTKRVVPESDKVSLTDAKVVVSGGRGVGSAEGFEVLEELASLINGAIGCSRAVTNHGWRPHADQVGQTGARVAPDLYIANGISGAIQHVVGCKGSKNMLVINTDPDAPILARANYAVIGDLHEVLPAVSEEIRKQRGE
ncbi:MAG: electron transfer flavoprotein subunit alpha/FixB family protein [Chloroflexota bacterium]